MVVNTPKSCGLHFRPAVNLHRASDDARRRTFSFSNPALGYDSPQIVSLNPQATKQTNAIMQSSQSSPTVSLNLLQPSARGCRRSSACRAVAAIALVLALLLRLPCAFGQSSGPFYGPPKIAASGSLQSYSTSGPTPWGEWQNVYGQDGNGNWGNQWTFVQHNADFYSGDIVIDDRGWVYAFGYQIGWYTGASGNYGPNGYGWYPMCRFINSFGGDLSGFAAVDTSSNFLGLSTGITVISPSGSYSASLTDANGSLHSSVASFTRADGAVVSKFLDVPGGPIQINGSSPLYSFNSWWGAGEMVIDAVNPGGWPQSNLLFTSPPATMNVNGRTYTLAGTSSTGLSGYSLSEGFYYTNPTGGQAGFGRYWTGNTSSGAVWATPPTGASFSGSLDPYSYAVSNLVSSTGATTGMIVTFGGNLPSTPPLYGPPAISWNGTTLAFTFTDSTGADGYQDFTGAMRVSVRSGWPSPSVSAWQSANQTSPFSGSYASPVFSFDSNNYANSGVGTMIALDANGDPLGTSAGIVLYFGVDGLGRTLHFEDGTYYSPTYTFRRNDGSWGVKFTGLPTGYFTVTDSPLYRFTGADMVISTVASGWSASNVTCPPQLYVNGILSPKDASGSLASQGGSQAYHGAGVTVTLGWSWTATAPAWSVSGTVEGTGAFTGIWDGQGSFTSLPAGVEISLNPSWFAPRFGPALVDWNGERLIFDPIASQTLGVDVYGGTEGFQMLVSHDGTVVVQPKNGGWTFGGYYLAGLHRLTFDTTDFGTVSTLDGAGNVLVTTVSSGGGGGGGGGGLDGNGNLTVPGTLDIRGNTLNFGSWVSGTGTSVNGLTLAFVPAASGANNQIRLDAARPLTDWLWLHAQSDGSGDSVTAMKLDSSHRLSLFDPASPANSIPGIVLNPGGRSRFDKPVRIAPQGDISMGVFTADPEAP